MMIIFFTIRYFATDYYFAHLLFFFAISLLLSPSRRRHAALFDAITLLLMPLMMPLLLSLLPMPFAAHDIAVYADIRYADATAMLSRRCHIFTWSLMD